jgi:hypothetical protein
MRFGPSTPNITSSNDSSADEGACGGGGLVGEHRGDGGAGCQGQRQQGAASGRRTVTFRSKKIKKKSKKNKK